jgi:hypothetical protein
MDNGGFMNSLSFNKKFTAERAVPVSKRRVYALGLVRFNLSSPTAGSAEDQGNIRVLGVVVVDEDLPCSEHALSSGS